MPVTRLGLIRVQGPLLICCPRSRKPPALMNTCQRSNIPDILESMQGFKLCRLPMKILRRVPCASHDLSARKLAKILDHDSLDGSESSRDYLFCSLPAAYECQIEAVIAEAWLHTPTSFSKRKWTLTSSSLPLTDEQVISTAI